LISTVVIFQTQNKETINSNNNSNSNNQISIAPYASYRGAENLKSCCVLQDHYDDERDKDRVSQHNTTPARPRPIFFGLRPVLTSKTDGRRPHHCWGLIAIIILVNFLVCKKSKRRQLLPLASY